MSAANNNVEEVSHLEIFACIVSIVYLEARIQLRTTLNCGMTARQFQITSANVRVFGGYAMPSCGTLLNYTLAEN